MTCSHALRRLFCILLAVVLLSFPVSAFVIGTSEDLESLQPAPENSEPLPPKNAAPIATNLEFSTYKNVAINGEFSAFDPEGDLLTFRVMKNPARGSVTIDENNSRAFVYTPYENKTGKDSFTYVVEDAQGNTSATATVKIKIQKPRSKVNYADMAGNPAHKAAMHLAELDILVGQRMGDTYFFHPEQTLSREEFLSMAMKTLDSDLLRDAVTTGFSDDIAIDTWAKPYVATALYNGVIQGSADESGQAVFRPDAPMTRVEASVLLDRLMQFSDVHTASADAPTWAAQSVANLEAIGVLATTDTLNEALTKGEAAMMLSATLDVLDSRKGSNFLFS